MESLKFGYVRVSSKDQNEARQIEEMKKLGIEDRHIFVDKESGKDFDREQYQGMVSMLREGDVIFIASIDRLGRNYKDILREWQRITKEKGADIVVLDMPLLDTRRDKDLTGVLISDIVLQLLSYVAERERENIRKRQAEGIALAKARGAYKGRQPKPLDKGKFERLYKEAWYHKRSHKSAMQELGVSQGTYYKYVKEYETKTGLWKED